MVLWLCNLLCKQLSFCIIMVELAMFTAVNPIAIAKIIWIEFESESGIISVIQPTKRKIINSIIAIIFYYSPYNYAAVPPVLFFPYTVPWYMYFWAIVKFS